MSVDEQAVRVRRSLEDKLGVEEALFLTDRPAGGWSSLVTDRSLAERLTALRADVVAEMHREFRAQTWRLVTALLATLTVMIALFGVVLTVVARG